MISVAVIAVSQPAPVSAQAVFRDSTVIQEPQAGTLSGAEVIQAEGGLLNDIFVGGDGPARAVFPDQRQINLRPPNDRATSDSSNSFVPGGDPGTRLTVPSVRGTPLQSGQPRESAVSDSELETIEPGRIVRRSREDDAVPRIEARPGVEIIIQNYPDGRKMLEKEVRMDESGNIRNDGLWRVFDRAGKIQAVGQFRKGEMVGVWKRTHTAADGGIFAEKPFNMFNGPFTSIATFKDDKLHGTWSIRDQYERTIFEIQYRNGVREGTAMWRYPNATRMRIANFKDGLLHGGLYEWDENSKLTREEQFIVGRRKVNQTTFYRPGIRNTQNTYLDSKLEFEGEDDWWEAAPAPMRQTGEPVQDGPAIVWYPNKQPKMRGQYKEGQRVGVFTWWHENGTKQGEGEFVNGVKNGTWTWWHENGMKAIRGDFENDETTGVWMWWDEDGSLDATENRDADADDQPAGDAGGNDDRNNGSQQSDETEPVNAADESSMHAPSVDSPNPIEINSGPLEVQTEENTSVLQSPNPLERAKIDGLEEIEGMESGTPGEIPDGN